MIFQKICWCYCILILQVMCRDPPTVKIKEQGTIMGMLMKMYRTQRIVAYLGIPYAHPPTGMLRFSPPVIDNLPSWDGVRNGSMAQPNCYQNTKTPKQKHTMVLNKLLNKVMDMDAMMKEMSSDQYDEDCLYLNLFVPDGESFCRATPIDLFRAQYSIQPSHECLSAARLFFSFFFAPFRFRQKFFQPLNSLAIFLHAGRIMYKRNSKNEEHTRNNKHAGLSRRAPNVSVHFKPTQQRKKFQENPEKQSGECKVFLHN